MPQVDLSLLPATAGASNINVPLETTIYNLTKTACSDFTQTSDYTIYKEYLKKPDNTGYVDRLTFFLNGSTTPLTRGLMDSSIQTNQTLDSTTGGYTALKDFLDTLELQKPYFTLAAECMSEQASFDMKTYDAAKQEANESKLRLDGIRTSDTQVSYYEGWFPLFRPMSETALFGLFSVSIAILLGAIVMYLRMQGIELQIQMPPSSLGLFAVFESVRQYSSYIWFAIAVGLAIGFAAYKMEWV